MDDELRQALAALPEEERQALLLRYGERLSTDATARRLGCDTSAARALLRAGLERLHDTLYPPLPLALDTAPRCELALAARRLMALLAAPPPLAH